MIRPGTLIGDYEIEALISEGGMATVYRARRRGDGQVVALKVLRDQYAADAEFVERFQREARAVASLSHPNMVQVYESGRAGVIHFIAMEFVEGQDLKRILRARGPLAADDAVRIAAQVCEVLEYAHRHGIVHRDIKPQNILLAQDGTVKVADFGIARALSAVTITQAGTVLGSVQYLSPEQARGETVGRAADMYALSVVLFEMVTGRLPFEGDSPIAIALRHIHDPPPPPRRFNPEVPPALEAIILRGMAKQPWHRYPSARDLATDLLGQTTQWREAMGAGRAEEETVVARPHAPRSSRTPARGARSRRRPVPVSAILAVALALVGSGLWGAWRWASAYLNVAEVEVPNLVGLPLAEAQAAAERAGLSLAVAARGHSGDVPADAVLSQDQLPGKRVKVGRVVNVVTSLGPEMVAVPDVEGQPLLQARLTLEDARLVIGQIGEAFDDAVRGGLIVMQDPLPGTPVSRGSTVDLVVSRGPELLEMPVLVGRPLREARKRLEELGLILRHVRQVVSPDLEPGVVVDQTPPPGQKVKVSEAEVVLAVSMRPGAEGKPPEAPVVTVERKAIPTPAPGRVGAQAGAEREGAPAVPGERRTAVRVVIPEGEPQQQVRIVVIDEAGVRTAYEKAHDPGERVNIVVRSRGYTIIQIYIDNRLIEEIRP